MEEKLRELEERELQYYRNREKNLREMLIACHERLEKILEVKDEEYLEQLQDLEEVRDRELIRLYNTQEYRLQRVQLTHDSEMSVIEHESEESLSSLNDKLKLRFQALIDYYKNPGSSVFDIDSDVHERHVQLNKKKKKLSMGPGPRGAKQTASNSGNDSDRSAELMMLGYDADLRHFEDWSQPVSGRKRNAAVASDASTYKDGDNSGSGGSGAATATANGYTSGGTASGVASGREGPGRRPKLESLNSAEVESDLEILRSGRPSRPSRSGLSNLG